MVAWALLLLWHLVVFLFLNWGFSEKRVSCLRKSGDHCTLPRSLPLDRHLVSAMEFLEKQRVAHPQMAGEIANLMKLYDDK